MAAIHVVASDLFFADRLGNALRSLGHQGRVVDLSIEHDLQIPQGVELVVVDLEAGESALTIIRAARVTGLPVLAFGPHTDLALREAALAAGASQVVAKSKLTTSFGELVAKMLP